MTATELELQLAEEGTKTLSMQQCILDNLHPLGHYRQDEDQKVYVSISTKFLATFKTLLSRSTTALSSENMQFYKPPADGSARDNLMTRWGGMLFRLMACEPFPSCILEFSEDAIITVHLAIVNEMNLFPKQVISPTTDLKVDVSVVSARQMTITSKISVHEAKVDSQLLDFYYPGLSFNGFHGDNRGAASFYLKTNEFVDCQEEFYLHISLQLSADLLAVPLLIGPFSLSESVDEQPMSTLRPLYISAAEFVSIKESVSDLPGKIWDSAFFVSTAVFEYSRDKDSFNILDLSTGNGAVGLSTLIRIQTIFPNKETRLTLTDLEEALPLITENVKDLKNQYSIADVINIQEYIWGRSVQKLIQAPFDVIVACDLIYENEFFSDLVNSLDDLCTPGKTRIFIGYKNRGLTIEEKNNLWDSLRAKFTVERISVKSNVAPGHDNIINDDVGVEVWQLYKNFISQV
ncbi:putative methyltransferase-domain-containing protein [Kockiozyma suomiensis]|uniref:putative methyltransferase-domain-containing protein n=1 Tax=Kockiozyma suomiensis TaxID=1337062 RepID=UPI003342F2F9